MNDGAPSAPAIYGRCACLPRMDTFTRSPANQDWRNEILLLEGCDRGASHSETSHSYYSENRGYVNNLEFSIIIYRFDVSLWDVAAPVLPDNLSNVHQPTGEVTLLQLGLQNRTCHTRSGNVQHVKANKSERRGPARRSTDVLNRNSPE